MASLVRGRVGVMRRPVHAREVHCCCRSSAAAVLVLGEASVEALSARIAASGDGGEAPSPPLPLNRFRTNVVVAGPAPSSSSTTAPPLLLPPFDEDSWATAAVGPGHILLRGCKLCRRVVQGRACIAPSLTTHSPLPLCSSRCRVTTTDQRRGEPAEPRPGTLEAEPLATLRRFRRAGADVFMGLNAAPQWDAPGGGSAGGGLRSRPRPERALRVGDAVHVIERRAVPPAPLVA